MEKESITNDNKKDSFFEKYKKEEDAKYEKWSKDYDSLVNKWDQDHKKYLTRVESYKLHTEKVESDKEILKRLKKEYKYETIKVSVLSESKIVDSAMDFDVKDQALRPTCSAFAAIRGIEIKLKQQNKLFDLSEQYFYWASKPNCQKKKCSQKGSWAGYGLEHSKESKRKDIPLLKDCPYKDQTNYKNETQIPLENSCKSGVAKVGAFSYIKNLDEVLKSIDNNNPVIAGITLDSRFYFNKGYIGLKNKLESSFKDSHANGHAVLFIGYKKLPEELHKEEGKVCFIAANSWGIGWGRAGHACISEKWLLKNKRDTPFMSIDKVI